MADKRLTTHAEYGAAANKICEALATYNAAVRDAQLIGMTTMVRAETGGLVALKSVTLEIEL